MSEKTMKQIVDSAFSDVNKDGYVLFSFQGGEPTLIGLEFYKGFVEYVRKKCPPRVTASFSIQTNGYMIDGVWAEFFSQNGFLIGISIDGGEKLHDQYRLDKHGEKTFARVSGAFQILKEHNADVNVLTVVTKQCAEAGKQVYSDLKKLGADYIQFIPCLEPINSERGTEKYALTAEKYGEFLCEVFEAWYEDWKNCRYVSVRLFEDYVHLMLGQAPSTCATSGQCGSYAVIESNGNVYPCDFYVLDDWLLGNVKDMSFSDLLQSETAAAFLIERFEKAPKCSECEWLPICRGGCKRDWVYTDSGVNNYFCSSYKAFFEKSIEKLREIALAELKEQEEFRLH